MEQVVGKNDQIGSASASIKSIFSRGWYALVRQRGRDKEINKMTTSRLKYELQKHCSSTSAKRHPTIPTGAPTSTTVAMQDSGDEGGPASTDAQNRNYGKLATKAQLQSRLRELDPIRQITSTSIRYPEEGSFGRKQQEELGVESDDEELEEFAEKIKGYWNLRCPPYTLARLCPISFCRISPLSPSLSLSRARTHTFALPVLT